MGCQCCRAQKPSGLQFVALKPAMQREVFMMLRRDRELNPSARACANAVRTGLMQAVLHGSVQLEAAD